MHPSQVERAIGELSNLTHFRTMLSPIRRGTFCWQSCLLAEQELFSSEYKARNA